MPLSIIPTKTNEPDGYGCLLCEKPLSKAILNFRIEIHAIVLTRKGTPHHRPRKDETTGDVRFELDSASFRDLPPVAISTVEDFREFVDRADKAKATVEPVMKIPRFLFQYSYWPISTRAMEQAKAIRQEGREPTFEEIEGPDLSRAWEIFEEATPPFEETGISLLVPIDDIE